LPSNFELLELTNFLISRFPF